MEALRNFAMDLNVLDARIEAVNTSEIPRMSPTIPTLAASAVASRRKLAYTTLLLRS
jgi:hypothetical protein